MKRREFLKQSILASAGTLMVPSFLKSMEFPESGLLDRQKNLVVIQLSGGNDGLNTVIPYGNDIYYKVRQNLAVPKNKIIQLNDMQGLNPVLAPLREIYDNGWMSIINDVGYPNPNRSHFRSMDIWQTASRADQTLATGWIGRYLDSGCSGCVNPHNAIEIDDTLSLALKGVSKNGIALKKAKTFYNEANLSLIKNLVDNTKEHLDEDNLGYLYKTLVDASSSAKYIEEKTKNYNNNFQYPNSLFSKNLKTVADFICSGLNTRIYYISLSGFDTHVNQTPQQKKLLIQFSEGINAFLKDLKKNNRLDDTLVMTFSEFGRRVEENASKGTDHGTANVMMFFGGGLKKQGIYNDSPNLTDLDAGDLKYKVDFRDVYATVLSKWIGADTKTIIPGAQPNLNFI